MNVIVRMMLFFPHSLPAGGSLDLGFLLTSLASMGLSTWILMRLDRPEVHAYMIT
jgi:hypothetical protein